MYYALLFSTCFYIKLVYSFNNKIENRDIVDLKSAPNLDNLDGSVVEHLLNSTENIDKLQVLNREGGDNEKFIAPVPKVLYVGLTTFGTFIEILIGCFIKLSV